MPTRKPDNWLDELLPFPRPEYAKQTESLLTDLLWRSDGSSLSKAPLLEKLGELKPDAASGVPLDPERLIPRRRHGGSAKLVETLPLAETMDTSLLIAGSTGPTPIRALLESVMAPRARGAKSDACVPVHPSLVALQTLHGLVNKQSPANLASAIETMGWLGGAPAPGSVASSFLGAFDTPASPRDGATGLIENLSPSIAQHVWATLPTLRQWQTPGPTWQPWPGVTPVKLSVTSPAPLLSHYDRTPFGWFWRKWKRLVDPTKRWHEVLPARRYVDWSMCLLRTGLAFSYLWEAEFFTRLHGRISHCLLHVGNTSAVDSVGSMLKDGAVLATFEPPGIPSSQKGIWPATREMLARGYEARRRFHGFLDGNTNGPPGVTAVDALNAWVQGLSMVQVQELGASLQTTAHTANNQKEFVRYLILPRSSDDDMIDQADFYYLARSNSRHTWFHPGPEWLVVITSLLCEEPNGQCTLGDLHEDLVSLGVRVDRSVLVGLLEESGLSTDSPDADNALVIKSGF